MLISNSIFQNQKLKSDRPNFKSVYPVVHWVAETNGSYAPVVSNEIAKTLNTKIIRFLNTSSKLIESRLHDLYTEIESNGKSNAKIDKEIAKLNLIKRVKTFISRKDPDYLKSPFARGFYDRSGGLKNNEFDPLAYILTGDDANYFENNFGRPIGQIKNLTDNSDEIEQAKFDYYKKGYKFVKQRANSLVTQDNSPVELHVKMEIARSKSGAIKDYNIIDMKFFSKDSNNNPFKVTEIIK